MTASNIGSRLLQTIGTAMIVKWLWLEKPRSTLSIIILREIQRTRQLQPNR